MFNTEAQRALRTQERTHDRLPTQNSEEPKKRPTGKVINGYSAKIIEKCLRISQGKAIDVHVEKMANRRTRMTMKVEIKDNKLFIEIDLEEPTPSSSGKTLVVASTHGNLVTTAKVNDKPITIGLNAYIKP